ncbi:SDR family oxidoreductase [Candidatus Haliotispira prima]|uniref:SDR family oxidoreductase n=1 Tax=Candidatus Haliotispira prima TaxID=3034016 RepID=A0ABY8MGD3_9SPIO|nr:SDR family oxidoreductase [Candidatus Haliotispira prima]
MGKHIRKAFVTGGSRGIGKGIVTSLVKDGYDVAFSYVSKPEIAGETVAELKALAPSVKIQAYQMDLQNARQIEEVAEQVLTDFDEIGVVVNNAAMLRNNAAAIMSDEEWDDVIAADLSGPFYVIRSFLMHMISNRFGRIINISSLAQDGVSGQVNYAAAKAGLVGMTKSLSREYGPKGITSNIVSVGLVDTDMTREHAQDEMVKLLLNYCPLRRYGEIEEIANTVRFLSGPEAGYINGESIRVAGGLSYVP